MIKSECVLKFKQYFNSKENRDGSLMRQSEKWSVVLNSSVNEPKYYHQLDYNQAEMMARHWCITGKVLDEENLS